MENVRFAGGITNLSPSLWHFGHLTRLYLRNNQLVSLPADIAHLSNLVHLDVSSNKLQSLPPELGEVVSLKELLLGNNHLGHLPCELGRLFQLQKLGDLYVCLVGDGITHLCLVCSMAYCTPSCRTVGWWRGSGRRSLAGGLSLIYAGSVVDM